METKNCEGCVAGQLIYKYKCEHVDKEFCPAYPEPTDYFEVRLNLKYENIVQVYKEKGFNVLTFMDEI
ncbi:MAG: hypothetical protein ACYDEI_00170 [Erysipelotrichaceae bacterium]